MDKTKPVNLGLRTLCGFTLLLWLLLHASLPAGDEPQRFDITDEFLKDIEGEEWYGIYINNQKMGCLRTELSRQGEGKNGGWVCHIFTRLKLLDMGEKNTLTSTEEMVFDASPPYRMRNGQYFEMDERSRRSVRLKHKSGNTYEAVQSEDDVLHTREIEIDYTMGDQLALEYWIYRHKPEAGNTMVTRSFTVDDLCTDELTNKITSKKTITVDGVKTEIIEVDIRSRDWGKLGIFKVDTKGALLSTLLGGIFEARKEPKSIARNIECSQDLFVLGLVKLDKPLGIDPGDVKRLVLQTEGEAAKSISNGPGQSVSWNDGVMILTIDNDAGEPVKATREEIKKNLEDTIVYPCKHPTIVALAKKAIGDAVTDQAKVERLVEFVDDYIKDEYGQDSMSVLAIIKKRAGDCTEHAQLFTTLARACGIPSREDGGLVYMDDDSKSFGWHAWNQVVLDGNWIPVDPIWRETRINATHISFMEGNKDRTLEAIGGLSFKLITVEK